MKKCVETIIKKVQVKKHQKQEQPDAKMHNEVTIACNIMQDEKGGRHC